MTCDPGDLVLIAFPFSDFSSHKKRPVLVMTSPDRYGDFIGLAVTSTPMQESAIFLEPSAMIEGILPKPSWVRLDKVYTLDTGTVVKKIGKVSPDLLAKAVEGLCDTMQRFLIPSPGYHIR